MNIRVSIHPLAWERLRPILAGQGLDPVTINGELMITPTVEQETGWRRQAALRAIPDGDLVLERIEHTGQQAHQSSAGVRIRHLPTQIIVESRNHPKLLLNKVDALAILADRLLELETQGVTPWWKTDEARR